MDAADQARCEVLKKQIAAAEKELRGLTEKIRKRASIRFIQENGITRDQVEFVSADGNPWFGVINTFAAFLANKPDRKPWAEWNGSLIRTQDLIDGESPDWTHRVDDLPE